VVHHVSVKKFWRWWTWRRLALVGGVILLALGGYVAFDNRESTPVLVAGVVLFALGLLADRLRELTAKRGETEVKVAFAAADLVAGAAVSALVTAEATPGLTDAARAQLQGARNTVEQVSEVVDVLSPDAVVPASSRWGIALRRLTSGVGNFISDIGKFSAGVVDRQGDNFSIRVVSMQLIEPPLREMVCMLTGDGGTAQAVKRLEGAAGVQIDVRFRFPDDFGEVDFVPRTAGIVAVHTDNSRSAAAILTLRTAEPPPTSSG
jgi:hypothetical protein